MRQGHNSSNDRIFYSKCRSRSCDSSISRASPEISLNGVRFFLSSLPLHQHLLFLLLTLLTCTHKLCDTKPITVHDPKTLFSRHLSCMHMVCILYMYMWCARKLCLVLSCLETHCIFSSPFVRSWVHWLQCSFTFHEPIPARNHAAEADSFFLILVASRAQASERAFSICFARCVC